jgi:hypothetical protein
VFTPPAFPDVCPPLSRLSGIHVKSLRTLHPALPMGGWRRSDTLRAPGERG